MNMSILALYQTHNILIAHGCPMSMRTLEISLAIKYLDGYRDKNFKVFWAAKLYYPERDM